uniref:HAD-IB family hydrolase n=1 Tax=Roseihalotalea indica TaxID=2867963 RepID=A0AA49GMV7_9BACT|nr:HAD-IB family hydrolase [Tunicatimonas sp. TK19036]
MKTTADTQTPVATSRCIAFFDFDGTITNRDSFLDFIKFDQGKASFYWGFVWLLPSLIAYKLKLIPNWRAKEKVLTYFFKNTSLAEFQQRCDQYAKERLPHIIRAKALRAIKKHQAQGHDVYLVSASPENWLEAWCHRKGIRLIATRLEVVNERITGKLCGKNCYGPEKAARIQQEIMLTDYHNIYSYGDSRGDKEMLALADFSYYRPFH